ncbi:YbhB/YbcL family Raf kinase inhibitor-like protein [Lysinibacter cavernae]|uniref:YbhB/YbcL family Raf kinase inhibitor-like protein n=1 Tax=Lysinibacter cavernae TaxID=1640652 RepID=A0A7X5R071_9MICO|nr:YbhB/YbcL family Raf kinase inhibitor-like protein [Lysinibacter cavernae]NIH53186.1 hypothetical protein [Lysinibacter cavernae]
MLNYNPYDLLDPVAEFAVTSTDISDGTLMGSIHYDTDNGGTDTSPQLSWSGFPAETKSFAVTCFDPDAPTASGFWHWAVLNIPAGITDLATGAGSPDSALLPPQAVTLPNEVRLTSYTGAAPPEGTGVHRYLFVVHAVDVERLDIPNTMTPAVLGFNLHFHTLGRAILTGLGEYGTHEADDRIG